MDRTIDDLQAEYAQFLADREWTQFHTPQNVAQAISVEASELLELFLWHDNLDADRVAADEQLREEIRMELADVVIYCMSMADRLDIDLTDAVAEKMRRNEERFDPETAAAIRERTSQHQRE